MALERERIFEDLGPSSAVPAVLEVVVAILSFYVSFLRLTVLVSPVTISQYAI
jgi:hypothetical protein